MEKDMKEIKKHSFGIGISASCTTGRESDRLGREEKRKRGIPDLGRF